MLLLPNKNTQFFNADILVLKSKKQQTHKSTKNLLLRAALKEF